MNEKSPQLTKLMLYSVTEFNIDEMKLTKYW